MTLTTDLFKDSWLYQDGLHDGEAVGLAKGEVKGAVNGRRESIAKMLGARFPSVSAAPLDAVTDPRILDDLLIDLADARNAADAQAVLDRL